MSSSEQLHYLDKMLRQKSKSHIVYYSSNAIKYGKKASFLQKRTHSVSKVQPQVKMKKKQLIDEQLTVFLTAIQEAKRITRLYLALNPYINDPQYHNFPKQVKEQYKSLLHFCKKKSLVKEKRQRSYSLSKINSPYHHWGPAPKIIELHHKLNPEPFYFKGYYNDLERIIIQTRGWISIQFGYVQKQRAKMGADILTLWDHISFLIQQVATFLFLDCFSKCNMTNTLKNFNKPKSFDELEVVERLFSRSSMTITWREYCWQIFQQLQYIAETLGIQIDDSHLFDLKKLKETLEMLGQKWGYQNNRPINYLAKVKKIKRIPGAEYFDKHFSVQYFIGLSKDYTYQELIQAHPEQLKRYLVLNQ